MGVLLLPLLTLPACDSVRTVYDEDGNVVRDKPAGAQESDMFSSMEKRFDAAFSEDSKSNSSGVPQAKSKRVSSFQRDIDGARKADNPFATKAFTTNESGLKSMSFSDRSKSYKGKSFSGGFKSAISSDMRPDFMNDSHGIAHSSYSGGISERSRAEGSYSDDSGRSYGTHASRYSTDQESGYFESHRHDTPAPPIRDHRSTQTKELMNVRSILGRDKSGED